MYRAHTVSVGIAVAPKAVYEYVSDGTNLPVWASGLATSIRKQGNHWIAETPMGQAKVTFAPVNEFGVADHDVELPTGKFHNPMRVVPNGSGSEVLFTLVQLPGVDDAHFDTDLEVIRADLNKLRTVLEHAQEQKG
jgi:hypothetical protein